MTPDPVSPAPVEPGPGQPGPGQPGARAAPAPVGPAAGSSGRHVVVVGGGLAGITAAIALREAGNRVTLLESRPRLGGLRPAPSPGAGWWSTTASTCSSAAAPPTGS